MKQRRRNATRRVDERRANRRLDCRLHRFESLESRRLLAVVVVDATTDLADGDLSSIAALANSPGNDGVISLREAITAANNTPNVGGPDEIHFAIPGAGPHAINVGAGGLPVISEALIVDGFTQGATTPGDATDDAIANSNPVGQGLDTVLKIELLGGSAGAGANGLEIGAAAGGSTIRGLAIGNFGGDGIHVDSDGNTIVGNFVGTDASGTVSRPNAEGIQLDGSGNTIGGTDAADRNLVSGNAAQGLTITAADNFVEGNLIGTDAAGTAALANGTNGVFINGVAGNVIGGAAAGAGNLISGNVTNGVTIVFGTAPGNTIQGNFIGTDVTGTADLGNGIFGVFTFETLETQIGGTAAGAGNLISGNDDDGVFLQGGSNGAVVEGNYIGTNAAGDAAIGNGDDGIRIEESQATIGGSAAGAGNLISGNLHDGVELFRSTGNIVVGNRIGTNAAGTAAIANEAGVFVSSASSNRIGGTLPGEGNVISGNSSAGVAIGGSATGPAANNIVEGNRIGTNASGMAAVGNSTGVSIRGANNNTIGGTTAAARNVISGNFSDGIFLITGGTIGNPLAPSGNQIKGNYIGLNAAGNAAIGGHVNNGITILGGIANVVGGDQPGEGNVISGNESDGIQITDSATEGMGNVVQGNLIGTDATGSSSVPNTGFGIQLLGNHTVIGGGTAAAGNVISGNVDVGIVVSSATGALIENNLIGLTSDGSGPLGNGQAGIRSNAGDHIVRRNTIAYNSDHGIFVSPGSVTGVEISENRIFGNARLGIDLGDDGITFNDSGDSDTGPNMLQNFPVLSSVTSAATTQVMGTLNSTPNASFRIEFFANAERDYDLGTSGGGNYTPGQFGEGEVFLGSIMVVTNGSGVANFTASSLAAIDGSTPFVTATATDVTDTGSGPRNNTSEFGPLVALGGPSTVVTQTGEIGIGTLREAIFSANLIGGANTITFNIAADDPRHFYYVDDGVAGSVSQANIAVTTEANDSNIPTVGPNAIDPDWSHSWFSIALDRPLAEISERLAIDGYTQPGSSKNTLTAPAGLDTVLKIEIDGSGAIVQPNGQTNPDILNAGLRFKANLSRVEGLVINRFAGHGLYIDTTGGNLIAGNFIGTDVSGTVDLGNFGSGVDFGDGEMFNRVGGAAPALRNLISGNQRHGIRFEDSGGDVIIGNLIGTDRHGLADLSNQHAAVLLDGAYFFTVGGVTPAEANRILANGADGIAITHSSFSGEIGPELSITLFDDCREAGNAVFEARDDFFDSNSSLSFFFLELSLGAFGLCAINHGLVLDDFIASGNAILGNSITVITNEADDLGIDLVDDGVTANDFQDVDGGFNSLRNFPVLTSVEIDAGTTTIEGTLNSAPNNFYRIEFYSDEQLLPSGHGAGNSYLGFVIVSTDANGDAAFSFNVPFALPTGSFVSATSSFAADADDDPQTPLLAVETSEFSAALVVGHLAGDYNENGAVDAADYTVWRDTLGHSGITPYSGADGNGDGMITAADYQVWVDHFGEVLPPGSASGAIDGALAAAVSTVEPAPALQSEPTAPSVDPPPVLTQVPALVQPGFPEAEPLNPDTASDSDPAAQANRTSTPPSRFAFDATFNVRRMPDVSAPERAETALGESISSRSVDLLLAVTERGAWYETSDDEILSRADEDVEPSGGEEFLVAVDAALAELDAGI